MGDDGTAVVTITAFAASPDGGQGHARDMRVRWALEETGQPYRVRLLSFAEMKADAHLSLSPFGQIPTYEEPGLALFETGAILLRLADRHAGLVPAAPAERARAIAWLFAAVNTVEPPVVELEMADIVERDEPWYAARRPLLEARVRARLAQLAARIAPDGWLEGEFSVADLMMVSVLRRLEGSDLLAGQPTLAAYVARGEARPAYRRAFAAQRAVFDAR